MTLSYPTKRFRIFGYCWDLSYQYELIKSLQNSCDFYYCLNSFKQWDKSLRPVPENLKFVSHYEAHTYDIAILHIDQRCTVSNSREEKVYMEFDEVIKDIPKVVLNLSSSIEPENGFAAKPGRDHVRNKIKSMIRDNVMVVNSELASSEEDWGFGIPIVPGLNSSHWNDLPKEPRIFTDLTLDETNTSYYNIKCLRETSDYLLYKYGYNIIQPKHAVLHVNSFDNYRDLLGRSLLYLDAAIKTPMNQARSEAFLSGACVVQVQNAHDPPHLMEDRKNIVLVPDNAKEICKTIVEFLEHSYGDALTIGQQGKKMATQLFCVERFRDKWLQLINYLVYG